MAKKQKQTEIEMVEVDSLVAHPDNPRTVRLDEEFVASVRAVGVIEPLTVRDLDGAWQVLSGHRRLAAAKEVGLTDVPVRNLGRVGDREAFDIVAMANLHEDLTPLEEGKRAAIWLDRYDQDAEAVAGKLGRTPRWVVQHAQIHRNLCADWRRALESGAMRYGTTLREMTDRWTASHWAAIARLPERIQIAQLKKFESGSYCSFDRWSVKDLESRIALEMLDLDTAPFDVATCAACVHRTGNQPAFLWSDEPTGDKCLDKKCWDKKVAAAERKAFKALAAEKEVPDAVALSMAVEPEDYFKEKEYRKQMSAVKRAHTKLLTAGDVEIVKKGDEGAVAAIVVAGRGKGEVKWVRLKPKKKSPKTDSGNWERQRAIQEAESRRWKQIEERIKEQMRAMPTPQIEVVALLAYAVIEYPCEDDIVEAFGGRKTQEGVRQYLWQKMLDDLKYNLPLSEELWQPLCDLLGIEIDCQAMYDDLVAAEGPGKPQQEKSKKKAKTQEVVEVEE